MMLTLPGWHYSAAVPKVYRRLIVRQYVARKRRYMFFLKFSALPADSAPPPAGMSMWGAPPHTVISYIDQFVGPKDV